MTRDHGARPLRRRDRGRQGLRADAADRHGDLADHGGRGDARDARPARRLPLVRQPALHGRAGPAARSGCRSTSCGRRDLWFAISGVVVLIGVGVARASAGLNLGIDFKGGTQITFKTPKPRRARRRARAGRTRSARATPSIQGRGASTDATYKSFQIRTKHLGRPSRTRCTSDARRTKLGATQLGVKTVSSSFGRQIARAAILAIIVSLAADRRLHRDPVRLQVRGAGDRRAAPRRPDHRRRSTRCRAGR